MSAPHRLRRAQPNYTPIPEGAFERVDLDSLPSVGHHECRGGPVTVVIRELLDGLRREQPKPYVPR